ncbi:hypothetical protein DICSQDRAFT_157265 [Dichomitus squalens LYAD-421 SS1]|uniref:Uncharacterized protein n=1 Tax=Dichomitus squalens (strain LYAD-421) TaxID=732165 RepID=R7SNM8_DICSQ|nr:uncharacterized protein DICSQDRAFT_157265 [Dichomitus squalens LYAD-421 SS1]EJF57671.1 hypothetical protein DICSQDRAFT_157265 [Dichomitus squalens LYAD-421 SS1]
MISSVHLTYMQHINMGPSLILRCMHSHYWSWRDGSGCTSLEMIRTRRFLSKSLSMCPLPIMTKTSLFLQCQQKPFHCKCSPRLKTRLLLPRNDLLLATAGD